MLRLVAHVRIPPLTAIHGHQYSGQHAGAGPTSVEVAAGDTVEWESDFTVVAGGFKICATVTAALPPSPPPKPPATPGAFFSFDVDDGLSYGWSTAATDPSSGASAGVSPYGFNWRAGGTPSSGTGPASGEGGTTSRYYYAESSAPRATGDVYELHYDGSACGGVTIVREISFAYHMYGSTMGSLSVITSSGIEAWAVSGEQSIGPDDWKSATVYLFAQSFFFRAVRGVHWRSDIAIDSIRVGCGFPDPPSLPLPPAPPAPPFPPPAPPRCAVPFDLALILDQSGSMSGAMADLKEVAIHLLEQIDLTQGRASVIAFSSTATVLTPLTHDRASLYSHINSLVAGGGTQIDYGLLAGLSDEFKNSTRRSIMWLLSDGVNSNGDKPAIEAATAVKSFGITLFAVGLGGASVQTLDSMASEPVAMHSYMGTDMAAIRTRFEDFCSLATSPLPPPPPLTSMRWTSPASSAAASTPLASCSARCPISSLATDAKVRAGSRKSTPGARRSKPRTWLPVAAQTQLAASSAAPMQTASTALSPSICGSSIARVARPAARSHIRTLPSAPPEARRASPGELRHWTSAV